MSFAGIMRDALVAALAAEPDLRLNRIGDGPGEAAPVPHALLDEIACVPWGGKALPGWEARTTLTIMDRGGAERIAELCAAAERALAAMPRGIGEWETSGVAVTRSRLERRRDGMRIARMELRLRAAKTGD